MPKIGYKQTNEHKKHHSEASKGKSYSKDRIAWNKNKTTPQLVKDKLRKANLGKKRSIETKQKLKDINLGKHHTQETKDKISKAKIGKHQSIEWINKKRQSMTGERNPSWKGGINNKNDSIRKSWAMTIWKQSVSIRDNFICQKCKQRGGKLQIHHINNFADCIELRFEINNGITLCKQCHKEFHKWYGIKHNTQEQLNEFLGNIKPPLTRKALNKILK